jgi:hypothetical protein
VPDLKINILGNQVGIGDASNGLCGGMVFAVRDYFEAGIPIPPNTDAIKPTSGPLFDYIVRRLFDSFNLLLPPPLPPPLGVPIPPNGPGPATYMWLMNPTLPDHETDASRLGLAPHGKAWIMIESEWPKIKADIDGGRLSPIGLIELKSIDPFQMGNNHQVLVYGYDLNGTDLVMHLYDPNDPDNDNVTMSLSIADPQQTTPVTNSAVPTVWCFFRPDYQFSSPPAYLQLQADWRWCNKCQGLFFGGGLANSHCPTGGTHAAPAQSGSGNYSLPYNVPADPNRQSDWRWCNKCQGLFWGGGLAVSHCPAGGTHAPPQQSGSWNYSLPHNVSADPNKQSDWRWCNKCQGLFWGGGLANSHCPTGGTHAPPQQSGSGNYSLPHVAA